MTPTKDAALEAFIAKEGGRPTPCIGTYSGYDLNAHESAIWDAKLSGFRMAWEMLHEDAEPKFDADLNCITVPMPSGLHPATVDLVSQLAFRLSRKLRIAERKYGYSDKWKNPDWMDECRQQLREHVEKGDPLDVAAYCAFLMWHFEPTSIDAVRKGKGEGG